MPNYTCQKINNLENFENIISVKTIPIMTYPVKTLVPTVDPRLEFLGLLQRLDRPVPANVVAFFNLKQPDLNILSDSDNNYLLNIFRTFIKQKNSLLNDIKSTFDRAYIYDNTILNINTETKKAHLKEILVTSLNNNMHKYDLLYTFNLFQMIAFYLDSVLGFISIANDMFLFDISYVDCLFGFLQNLETLLPIGFSLYDFYNKLPSQTKQALLDNSNSFNSFMKPNVTAQNISIDNLTLAANQAKQRVDSLLIDPFLSTECTQNLNDCTAFYNNLVIGMVNNIPSNDNTHIQSWLFNQNVKSQIMDIFKINYNSIKAVTVFYDNLLTPDSQTINDTISFQKIPNGERQLQKILASKIFKEHFISLINEMNQTISNPPNVSMKGNDLNPPTTSAPTTSVPTTSAPTTSAPTTSAPTTSAPTTVTTAVTIEDSNIIKGVPNLFLFIGIAVIVLLILVAVMSSGSNTRTIIERY